MACSCTNQALRRFVLNVSQIEIPSGVTLLLRQNCSAQIRSINSVSATKAQWTTQRNTALRHTASPKFTRRFISSMQDAAHIPTSKIHEDPTEEKPHEPSMIVSTSTNTGAVIDLTPEALDQLLAEQEAQLSDIVERHTLEPLIAETSPERRSKQRERRNRRAEAETSTPQESDRKFREARKGNFNPISEDAEQSEDVETGAKDDSHEPQWSIQRKRLKEKFPGGWQPRKKLSPDALQGIRALHAQSPEQFTTEILAKHFEVSPEAIRRILKSKWTPTEEEQERRTKSWQKRGEAIWERYAALGSRPPRKWREQGIGRQKPSRDQVNDLKRLLEGKMKKERDMTGKVL